MQEISCKTPEIKSSSLSGEKLKLEPVMKIIKAFRSIGPHATDEESLDKQRKFQQKTGELVAPMSGMIWDEFEINNLKCAWMKLERPHKSRRIILYCHGGGFTSGNLGYSKILASKLTKSTGFDVLSFEYRLAPEFRFPAALEDALFIWNHLMLQGYGASNIIIAGDSAGGNLALSLCHLLKNSKRMLPGALILMSPWVDMTASGHSYADRADIDPILNPLYIETVTEMYAGGENLKSPLLSPIFGDFTGFPPTLIQVGSHEILFSDSEELRNKMCACGAEARLQIWEEMWHVFQMLPIKKADLALESVAHFLLEELY